jgi:hypothetical protein
MTWWEAGSFSPASLLGTLRPNRQPWAQRPSCDDSGPLIFPLPTCLTGMPLNLRAPVLTVSVSVSLLPFLSFTVRTASTLQRTLAFAFLPVFLAPERGAGQSLAAAAAVAFIGAGPGMVGGRSSPFWGAARKRQVYDLILPFDFEPFSLTVPARLTL